MNRLPNDCIQRFIEFLPIQNKNNIKLNKLLYINEFDASDYNIYKFYKQIKKTKKFEINGYLSLL